MASEPVAEKVADVSDVVCPFVRNESLIGRRRQPADRRSSFLHLPILRVLLSEIRNLLPRIRMRHGKGSLPLDAGHLYLRSKNGHRLPNMRMHGRIDCIKMLASNHPWTSSADWQMAVDAWDQGVEWAVRNLGSDSTLSEEHRSLLVSELSYKGPRQL
jgi:hypothetical protein